MADGNDHDDLLRDVGFYFYFPEKQISEEWVNYTTMAIVDGLNELGYRCYSNVEHRQLTPKALGDASPHVVVFDITSDNYSAALMQGIAEFKARAKLIHCRADEAQQIITPADVLSVTTHESKFVRFRQPRAPWAFGLSRTRIERHANTAPFSQRRRVLLRNFRPSFNQSVRDSLDLALVPLLERHFEIDRTCASEGYAERLAHSVGCLAYCGTYAQELTKNEYFKNTPALVELAANRTYMRETVVIRWDSWRFWESLASGCLTFQLDFDEYGFELPVMPVAWKHYIPLKLHALGESVTELMDREAEWESIAKAGRAWALEHYSPIPTARRFAAICRGVLTQSQ